MKNTGIVRRIDDLGRIVIPKEIRKTLRIFDGDCVEIYVNQNNEIILKKHSTLNNVWDFADDYGYCLSKFINNPILIFNKDKVIISHGTSKSKLINLDVSKNLQLALSKKTMLKVHDENMFDYPNNLKSYKHEFIVPIIIEGYFEGGICCLSKDALQNSDENLILLASNFIAKHLEKI